MLMKRPKFSLIELMVPETFSPTFKPAAPSGRPLAGVVAAMSVETLILSSSAFTTFTSTLSPSLNVLSPMRLFGPSTSVTAPMSKNTPKVLTLTTVPVYVLPTLTSDAKIFVVTRILRVAGVSPAETSKIFRPGILSPFLYADLGCFSCAVGNRASFSAPISTQRPMLLTRDTVPSNSSPTSRSERGMPPARRTKRAARRGEAAAIITAAETNTAAPAPATLAPAAEQLQELEACNAPTLEPRREPAGGIGGARNASEPVPAAPRLARVTTSRASQHAAKAKAP
mmetsp:Transcript_63488/g.147990  ORF Transcript_63488/g.147990 Transcript_63488/m.147990 type:complete len:284 (+) Transcript_63488:1918-2769(+)